MVNKEDTIKCILSDEGLFDAIEEMFIVNINYDAGEIKKQIQKLKDRQAPISAECEKIEIETEKLEKKIDKHVKDVVVKLELGGNYDDLMKMIKEIKA